MRLVYDTVIGFSMAPKGVQVKGDEEEKKRKNCILFYLIVAELISKFITILYFFLFNSKEHLYSHL